MKFGVIVTETGDDMQEIILNIESKQMRYAHLKNGQLYDLVVERKKARQLSGNIYRGRVTHILHNIQSAFIDINEGENGFIHISDIVENRKKFEELFDMDFENASDARDDAKDIEQLLKVDQNVLVQVVKEPIGSKGARLTSNISIAGRYLVLLPNSPHRGVSRKIEDRHVRERLKKLIQSFEMPQNMGLICRTASGHQTAETLIEEAHELLAQWQGVVERFHQHHKPACLYEESDLIKRAVMTAIDKKLAKIVVDDQATYQIIKHLYQKHANGHELHIEHYKEVTPLFERYNVEKEIEKALRHKIWLSSGGYLFFDRTEAMYTIDVNSGRSVTGSQQGDVEETLVRINLEAAEEIARQLRIRNIGGLVICDFIDMRSKRNQKRVLDKLKECMKDDSAKCTILAMSEFGLVEMTRQRNRESLAQTLFTHCPYCIGSGLIKTHETVAIELERAFRKSVGLYENYALQVRLHPELLAYLEEQDKQHLLSLALHSGVDLEFEGDDTLHLNDFFFHSGINGKRIEV